MATAALLPLKQLKKDFLDGSKLLANKLNLLMSILLMNSRNSFSCLDNLCLMLLLIWLNKEPHHIQWNLYKPLTIPILIIHKPLKMSFWLPWNSIKNAISYILEQWEFMVTGLLKDQIYQKDIAWQNYTVIILIYVNANQSKLFIHTILEVFTTWQNV